jgi:dihydroxyacetone kinase
MSINRLLCIRTNSHTRATFDRSTFLGSRAIAGTLLKHDQLAARGADGLSLEEVLRRTGVANPTQAVAAIALDPKQVC